MLSFTAYIPGIQLHDMVMRLRKLRGGSGEPLLQRGGLHALHGVLLREGEDLPLYLLHLLPGNITKRLYYLLNGVGIMDIRGKYTYTGICCIFEPKLASSLWLSFSFLTQ